MILYWNKKLLTNRIEAMSAKDGLSMSETLKNPEKLAKVLFELEALFEMAPPDELRNTLFEFYQVYIMHEHIDGFRHDFSRMAEQLYHLLSCLWQLQKISE